MEGCSEEGQGGEEPSVGQKEEKRQVEKVEDLSVGQDGGVVALEAALDELADARVVDVHLAGVHVEDVVVGEGLVGAEDHLRLARRHRRARPAHVDHLARRLWSDPGRRTRKRSNFYVRCAFHLHRLVRSPHPWIV